MKTSSRLARLAPLVASLALCPSASDYRGALVEFQRAYELSHNPRVLYNVGVTEKLLTHYARAVDAWEREMHEGASQLSGAEVQELKNAIAIVQQFVTT